MNTNFSPTPAQIDALVSAYPLAWIVSGTADDRAATVLPLLGERDHTGAIVALFGHFARSNRQVQPLAHDPRASILFHGPQGYIAPRLVTNPTWAPTWNYATVRFEAEVVFVPEENEAAIERLARAMEGEGADSWRPSRMGPRYAQLLRHIVAFRATVRAVHGKFKLGQDERPDTFDQIVGGLGEAELSRWMIAARHQR